MKKLFVLLVVCLLLEVISARLDIRHSHKSLKKCKKCLPGWGVVRPCSKTNDTTCEKCEFGKTYSPHHSYRSICWTCSKCGVGLYEAHACVPFRDTVCDDCTRALYKVNIKRNKDFAGKCSYLFLN